jgi:hypothetical protein
MLDIKGPVIYGVEWITDKLVSGFIDSFIASLPLMIGLSIAVYALLQMISRRLANLGVIGVFVYGALVAIA